MQCKDQSATRFPLFIFSSSDYPSNIMTEYIKNFVTGYGVNFEVPKNNQEASARAPGKWNEIKERLQINDGTVVMFCGGKNNGKSSLTRFLVNSYVHQKDDPTRAAYYIDFDPGQCEMTTPGVVSAHLIKQSAPKLQCPTYLNVLQHDQIIACSVGGTNMSVNPRMYIENCRLVVNQVKVHRNASNWRIPVFINTMGHIRNVGLAMLMDLIKICTPTNVVILNVENDPMRTIYADLSPSSIDSTRASFYYETSHRLNKKLNYQYDVYNLKFSYVDSSSIASKNRKALQLAYLASIPEALYKPIMQLEPKWLSLKPISVHCVASYPLKPAIALQLLMHSWVQLVERKKPPVMPNLSRFPQPASGTQCKNGEEFCNIIDKVGENILRGCGIVSDIDLEGGRLAIITPLSQEILDHGVDCLIKPLSIQVPHEVLQTDSASTPNGN